MDASKTKGRRLAGMMMNDTFSLPLRQTGKVRTLYGCLLMADSVENSRPWLPRQKNTRLRLNSFL